MKIIDMSPLDREVAIQGLMKRRYSYYIYLAIFLLTCTGISLYLMTFGDTLWSLLLNILLLGFLRLQGALIGHDFAHLQVSKSKAWNRFFASLSWGFFTLASATWWEYQHNQHHKNTNQIGSDPDVDVIFAFDEKMMYSKYNFYNKFFLPVQHFFLIPGLGTTFFIGLIRSIVWMIKHPSFRVLSETLLILGSLGGLVFFALQYMSLLFVIILLLGHIFFGGFYMGILFFPNHYGEFIVEKEKKYERMYQILASRNVSGGRIADFFLGGLNLQIEHHLYPTMPRCNLHKAKKLVQAFCLKNGIEYHEVSLFMSFVEMFCILRKIAKLSISK